MYLKEMAMYISLANLFLFWFSVLLLAVTPGVDVVLIASQSMVAQKNGILATLGTTTGISIYILLTILGLSVVLQHSVVLYSIIKFSGAAYLLYLAYGLFKSDGQINSKITIKQISAFESYKKGLYTNLLNPKIGIFFITFLPQFVNPKNGHENIQLLILGVSFMLIGGSVNLCYSSLFFHFKEKLFKKIAFMKVFNKVVAVLFCIMALKVVIG